MKKVVICILFIAFSNQAQWSTDITINNIVSWNTSQPIIASDNENGIIVLSQSHMVNPIIYANRINADGNRLWEGHEGLQISSVTFEQWLVAPNNPEKEFVIPDGSGGCYIAFQTAKHIGRKGYDPEDRFDVNLYIQHLDANGTCTFGVDGFEIMHEKIDSVQYIQEAERIVSDGDEGVIVIFRRHNPQDNGNGKYLAYISARGEFVWEPKRLSESPNNYFLLYLDANSNINIYCDPGKNIFGGDKFIKIEKTSGDTLAERQIEIGVGENGFSSSFLDYFQSDRCSSIFVFRDLRTDSLRAQKLNENGEKQWGELPVFITNNLRYANFDAESDMSGGAYILYESPDDSIHLVHLSHKGKKEWTYSYSRNQWNVGRINENLSVGSDGSVFIVKERGTYLTKLDPNGRELWESQVTNRINLASSVYYYGLKADSLGGCIVLWQEWGNGFAGLRAQRITQNGTLGGISQAPPLQTKLNRTFGLEALYPNPSNSYVTIRLALSAPESMITKIYNLLGKEVVSLWAGKLDPGVHSIIWDCKDNQQQDVSSGVYLLVCRTPTHQLIQKICITK